MEGDRPLHCWPVSTARKGAGELRGSECTPRGWHRIRARIGAGLPLSTVFRGRRPTGELFSDDLGAGHPQRDWILTRILWLGGLEPGFNRYGEVDTTWRYIYIHGSPEQGVTGEPASHGCIRLKPESMQALFDHTLAGMRVLIKA
jgi:hypothetical protein